MGLTRTIPSGTYVPTALVDAAGDLLVGTADNTLGRLAKGTALQTLRVNAGATALEWATSAAAASSASIVSLRNDFGLDPTSSVGPLTSAIQAAIDACIASGKSLDCGPDLWPINAALTIAGNLSIQATGAGEVWDNVTNSGLTGMPGAAPWVKGGGFVQQTAATDVLQITGKGVTVHLRDLVLRFADAIAFNNTGHGIWSRGPSFNGRYDNGAAGCRWDNIIVFGHDGNHYAVYTVNMNLWTCSQLRSYGGGGWYEEVNSNNSNYGNGTLIEPYFCVLASGTADGYHLKASASAPGTPGLLNLVTFIRPQTNFQTAAAPLAAAFTITTPPAASPTQQAWREEGASQQIVLLAPDFEANGATFSPSTTWIGPEAVNARTPLNNTSLGRQSFSAVVSNPTAHDNTNVGFNALNAALVGSSNYNTAIGSKALQLMPATASGSNTAVGYNALGGGVITTGSSTAVGSNALSANTSGSSTAVGVNALRDNTTGNNVAVGPSALLANTTGSQNVAVGLSALLSNLTGGNNVAIGEGALQTATAATQNTAVGFNALLFTTGNSNTAIGYNALKANTTGDANNAVGNGALLANTTGGNNVAVGDGALGANTTGGLNTAIGRQAGLALVSGSNNVAVGYTSGYTDGTTATTNNISNATMIGYQAQATTSHVIVLGSAVTANRPNLVFGQAGVSAAFGGGVGVFAIANAVTTPASSPVGGGVLYVTAGALTYKGSSGTVTTVAPA